MTRSSEITLIGGGIIGLLTAKELVAEGYQVTILDKSRIGTEASWAGGGILLPLYPWRQDPAIGLLALESIKAYPTLSRQLFETTQLDPQWYPCGLLICKTPDYQQAIDWCSANQIPYQAADQSLFKSFNTETIQPLWLPSIAQARNPRLLKSLKLFLDRAGVTFIENCEVSGCQMSNERVTTLSTNQGTIKVSQLVICSGAWTGRLSQQLFPELNYFPDIFPVKGQMILFDAKPDTLPCMILDNEHYLIPRKDGQILAGSSVEQCRFDKTPSPEMKQRLHDFAINLLPTLKEFPLLKHWAGIRPGTQQGVPYIDKHPEIVNVSINAGHFRNGLVMGPASARLMADLILDRTPSINPAPYRLNRCDTLS